MPSPSNNTSPRRAVSPRIKRLSASALLALVCGARAVADTITMQDAQKKDTKQIEKVRERVLERIAEGVTSGVECVEPGPRLPLKKELLIPAGVIVVTTVLISDPPPQPPEPPTPDRDPTQSVPEPATLLLLATGLGYALLKLRGRQNY